MMTEAMIIERMRRNGANNYEIEDRLAELADRQFDEQRDREYDQHILDLAEYYDPY